MTLCLPKKSALNKDTWFNHPAEHMTRKKKRGKRYVRCRKKRGLDLFGFMADEGYK